MSKPKLALVTGGAVRLGKAISRRLAAAGYCVVVHANRHLAEAQRLADELQGHALAADLTDTDAIDDLFAAVDDLDGDLHVLVNNAAIFHGADPEEVTLEDWHRQVAINLTAPWRCCQLPLGFGYWDRSHRESSRCGLDAARRPTVTMRQPKLDSKR